MHQPHPFNSQKEKKNWTNTQWLMRSGKNFIVLYSYKSLSTTALSGFLVLYLNFSALKCLGITDKKFRILFTESESLPVKNRNWLIFSMLYVKYLEFICIQFTFCIINSTTPIPTFLQSHLPLNHLISTLNGPLNLPKCDK